VRSILFPRDKNHLKTPKSAKRPLELAETFHFKDALR
jgi:hypothetical protein